MQKINYLIIGILAITLICSCQKDKDKPTALGDWGLIPDGGFESEKTFDYWMNTQFNNGFISIDNDIMINGSSSLYIKVEEPYWIDLKHLEIEIEPNTSYEFSVWYKYKGVKFSHDYPIMIGMYDENNEFLWTGGNSIGDEYTGDGIDVDWTKFNITFNSNYSTGARLFISSCMGNTWLDEIILEKVD